MKRTVELKYLFLVFMSLGLGFFLLHQSLAKRSLPVFAGIASGEAGLASFILNPYPDAFCFAVFAVLFLLAHAYLRSAAPGADPYILPAVAFISGIGLIMILRLAPDLAVLRSDALRYAVLPEPSARAADNARTFAHLGVNHLIHISAGVLAMVVTAGLLSAKLFAWMSDRRYVWILCGAVLFLLTRLFGTTINGRRLWLFGFQTIELVKLLVLFFIAGYLYNEGRGITFHGRGRFRTWCRYTIPYALACLAVIAPTVLQQDFGATMVLFAVCFIMLHLGGNRISISLAAVSALVLAVWASYTMDYPHVLRQRIDMFLDPFGKAEAMATVLWSISTGGVFGNGIGFGLAHRIPEVQSDFNFAAICEELGLAGGMALLLAYAVLVGRLLGVSLAQGNLYKKMLVSGVALTLAVQSFIIIAGNLNGIPLTGITLPFCSYGGSSLLASFIMAGIGIRVSSEER